jgi:hypothetical protein
MAYIRNFRYPSNTIAGWGLLDYGTNPNLYDWTYEDFPLLADNDPAEAQYYMDNNISASDAQYAFGTIFRLNSIQTQYYFFVKRLGGATFFENPQPVSRVIYDGTTVNTVIYNGTTVYDNTPETTLTTFEAADGLAGASNSSFAILIGGWLGSFSTSSGITLNSSLTRGTLSTAGTSTLVEPTRNFAGSGNGTLAVFAGGTNTNETNVISSVTAYNTSLTRSTPTTLGIARRNLAGSTGVQALAVFAGGANTAFTTFYPHVDSYNTSGTRTASLTATTTGLSTSRSDLAGGSTSGPFYIFAGGRTAASTASGIVNRFNGSMTRQTNPTGLSTSRYFLAGASDSSSAFFAGGQTDATTYTNAVDTYNSSGTRVLPVSALTTARSLLSGAFVGSYFIFMGGWAGGSSLTATDTYNTSLTKTGTFVEPTTGRRGHASATIGSYAVFGGGLTGTSTRTNSIIAYRSDMIF